MKTLVAVGLVFLLIAGALFVFFRHHISSTQQTDSLNRSPAIRYLALGDSYTVGQSVSQDERWPDQLTARLQADGTDIGIVGNPSVTGYTTQDLIDRELPLLATSNPNFVSVLIGVNDYVQGVPEMTFQKNFRFILDAVEAKVSKNRIVIVTIPDYALTPAGAQYGTVAAASAAIRSFNDFMLKEAASRGMTAVDVYPISQGVTSDANLTADDGLHPSGAQYKLWTDKIYQALIDAKTFNRSPWL